MDTTTRSLMLDLAGHLEGAARSLRRHLMMDTDQGLGNDQAASWHDPVEAVEVAREFHPSLGSHQKLVITKLAGGYPAGLTANEINENPSTLPNTYTTLDKLAELGLVRRQEGSTPRRYYFGPHMVERRAQ